MDEGVLVQRSPCALQILVKDTCHLNYSDMCFTSPVLQCLLWKNLGRHPPLALLASINVMVSDFLCAVQKSGDEVESSVFGSVLDECEASSIFRALRGKVL